MNGIFLCRLACLLLLIPGSAFSTTFYVGKDGSNSNSCTQAQNPSTPKLTIATGVGCMSGGDELVVSAGTYFEGFPGTNILAALPNGTSWDNVTTLRGKSGDEVIMQPTGSDYRCFSVYNPVKSYIEIDGRTPKHDLHEKGPYST